LQIAQKLEYIDRVHLEKILGKTAEVGSLLNGLKRYLEKND
jgi:hypothetical protein